MIRAIIKTAIIFGVVFSASTASTVAITKQLNKTPVKNSYYEEVYEEEEEYIDEEEDGEDEEYIPTKRELTDTEEFINALTSFGNLEANIDAKISYNEINVTLGGSIFVSLETLDDLAISFDLDIGLQAYKLELEGAYVDNTVFINANGNKLKLETKDIGDIVPLFNSIDIPFELPEQFANIDTDTLLANLGAMESVRGDNSIKYTCNLLPGIPPIIFTSDLSYKMTSIALHDLDLMGIKGDIDAEVSILGKGHNKIVNPEDENNKYINVTSYFGLVDEITSLVNQKQFGISYSIEAKENGANFISTNGKINLDIDDLFVSFIGNFNIKDLSFNIDASYLNDVIYLNYDNLLKLSYSANKITDLISVINDNIGEDTLSSLLDKLDVYAMPLVKCIKDKEYLDLLNYFDGLNLYDDRLVVNIDNGIFGSEESSTTITINFPNNKVSSLSIVGLEVLGYSFDLSFVLDTYDSNITVNPDEYTKLDDVNGLVSDICSLAKQDKFAINLGGSVSVNDSVISFTGSTQFDISTLSGAGHISILDNENKTHNVDIDIYDDSSLYFAYNNNLYGTFTLESIRETISMVKQLLEGNNTRIEKYETMFLSEYTETLIKKVIEGDYLALIKNNVIKSFTYANNTYTVVIDKCLLGSDEDILISIGTEDNKLSSLSISLSIMDMDLSLSATLSTWNDSYDHINLNNKKIYDFTEMSTLAEYLLNTASKNDFSLSGKIDIDMNAIGIINKSFTLGFDVKVHIDENENVVSCLTLTNIPNLGLSVLQSEKWDNRTFEIYISDEYVNLQTISTKDDFELLKWSTYRTTTTKQVHLTNQEMVDNLIYYFVNFGLGIDNASINEKMTASDTANNDIDYSTLLTNYKYNVNNNIPSWTVVINLAEIAASDMLSDVNATIAGNPETKLLSALTAGLSVDVASLITIDIDLSATINSFEYIGDSALNKITNFNSLCATYQTQKVVSNSSKIKI